MAFGFLELQSVALLQLLNVDLLQSPLALEPLLLILVGTPIRALATQSSKEPFCLSDRASPTLSSEVGLSMPSLCETENMAQAFLLR